jgi:hypothetical protein
MTSENGGKVEEGGGVGMGIIDLILIRFFFPTNIVYVL